MITQSANAATEDFQTARPPRSGTCLARVLRVADALLGVIVAALLLSIMGVVFAGIIARFVFSASLSWSEELASWMLVWLTFIGMAIGIRADRHVAITLLGDALNDPGRRIIRFVVNVVVTYTMIMLFFEGIKLVREIGGVSPGLQWDNWIEYVVIPACSAIGLLLATLARVSRGDSWSVLAAEFAIALALYGVTLGAAFPFPNTSPSLIMGIAFVVALALGVPIGFAMLFSVFLATWGADLLPAVGVIHNVVAGCSPFVLLAIPFFLTAGYLMNSGGLSRRIIDFANTLVGHFRGGLAQANVFHSVMLGGVCGSSSADAASTTKILVPEMMRRGYSGSFACAVTAVGSILPSCFPPSIALLVYASIASVSVSGLFTAGLIPGLMLCVLMMFTVHLVARKRNYERAPQRATARQMVWAGLEAAPASFVAVVILSLLRFGVMTPTEVGIVAVLWSFAVGKFLYRGFTMREFYGDMVECAIDSALISFLIGVAAPFAWVLVAEQMPQQIISWVTTVIHQKWELLLVANVVVLLAGCILEVIPSMLIIVPLMAPLLTSMGVNPIQLGIIIVFNLLLAEVSPPLGILVYISASIARVPTGAVFRECIPFVVVCFIGLLAITFCPALTLTLGHLISR